MLWNHNPSLVISMLVALMLSACSLTAPQQKSVVLILVEGLSFSSVTCTDSDRDETSSGFQIFCAESVRFTHAYTPSVLSQATVASMLAGRYPSVHGVWHNGNQFLSAKALTFAEAAYRKNFRTAFFSGGAPVFRKSGLNQGFEIFDDNIVPSLNRLYRPVGSLVDEFIQWRTDEVGNQKSVSVLYISDLQFTDSATTDELGMVRESSYQSQLHEVDVQLYRLIRELQKQNAWADSTVILAGVNGYPQQERLAELRPLNLYGEGTRVTLMIKPPRKATDEPVGWKYDANVSLVDVGATVFDLLDSLDDSGTSPERAESLRKILSGPSNSHALYEKKWILSSSAWCGQQGLDCGTRFGLREGPLFFLFDHHKKLYNTLSDNLETSSLAASDPRFARTFEFETFAREHGIQAWQGISKNLAAKLQIGKLLWNIRGPTKESLSQLRKLSNDFKNDEQLAGWRAILALRRGDWEELRAAARETNEDWMYVADSNLNEHSKAKPSLCMRHAISLLQRKQSGGVAPRECSEPELLRLYDLISENGDDQERQKAFDSFAKLYNSRMIDLRVAEQNIVADANWDVSLDNPSKPSMVDLILSLPDARRFRLLLKERLKI